MKNQLRLLSGFFICAILSSSVGAQTLSLDPSFGNNGKVEFPSSSSVKGVLSLPDGKILVVSHVNFYDNEVTRLNGDGSIDFDFGINGKMTLSQSNLYGFQRFENICSFTNGKIIIIGSTTLGSGSCTDPLSVGQIIIRLNENGTIDSTFDEDGRKIWYAMNLLGFSKLTKLTNGGYLLARYNAQYFDNFELLEFDENGNLLQGNILLQNNPEWGTTQVWAVTRTDDNKYLAVLSNGGYWACFVRFLTDGTSDTTYGNNSMLPVSYSGHAEQVYFINNTMAYLGAFTNGYVEKELLEVNLVTGVPNPSFGENGALGFDFGNSSNNFQIHRSNDSTWAATKWTDYTLQIIRLNADFTPDVTFAPNGKGILPIQFENQYNITQVAFDAEKKILIGGVLKTIASLIPVLIRVQSTSTTSADDVKNSGDSFHIWPNPVSDFLTIESPSPVEQLEVFTSTGTCALSHSYQNGRVNISNLKAGLYFLKIYGKEGNVLGFKQFVKQ